MSLTPPVPTADRIIAQPWAAAGLIAFLFVGLQGLWSAILLLSFILSPGEGFVDWSFRWEIFRSEWGIYLTYAVVMGVSGCLLAQAARAGEHHHWWTLLWRSVVLYLPASFLVTFAISAGAALIHGRSLHLFGVQLIS